MRMTSRLRRNAEPEVGVLSSMAHLESHRGQAIDDPDTLDAIVDADMILKYQNIPDEPGVEPDATSMYDIGMGMPGSAVDEEPTTTRTSVLMLVEFPCPLCHLPIVAEQHRGHLRVPAHQILAPIYPHGFGGPMFRAECPASGMPISEMCTGSHRPPACSDPRCLVGDGEATETADPTATDGPDGGPDDESDGGRDDDDAVEPYLAEPYLAVVASPVDAWSVDEHTTEGPAYSDPESP